MGGGVRMWPLSSVNGVPEGARGSSREPALIAVGRTSALPSSVPVRPQEYWVGGAASYPSGFPCPGTMIHQALA